MYRVVLYGLGILAGISILFGFTGLLPYSGFEFIALLSVITLSCYLTHVVSRKIFHSITNSESYLITALILFFILAPSTTVEDILISIAASVLAIISRYVLVINKKHIFNPAAVAVVILGLLGFGNAIWWVGSTYLLPFVVILGLLVVRKIRRFYLVWPFIVSALLTLSLFNLVRFGLPITQSVLQAFTSWPLIFFGTIMLTEPLTAPARKKESIFYSVLVGILFGTQFEFGPLFSSPELSLIIGNIFSSFISPKTNLVLTLLSKKDLGGNTFEFSFKKPHNFTFIPGQYLEWTVPHEQSDSRGNRRYFTIASSPTEETLKLGIKIPEKSSSFKQHLLNMRAGELLTAHQLAGDFTLPESSPTTQKFVFIAGGIGITPFRSMAQFALDKNQQQDAVLLFASSKASELVYQDLFTQTQKIGWKTVYILTHKDTVPTNWQGETGYITAELLAKHVPDYHDRHFYLSGPNAMVESYKHLLLSLNISRSKITTDYFPGF